MQALPTKNVEFFSQPQCPLGSPRSGVGGSPHPSAVDDGSAELGTACCRLVRRHQFQMSHVVASVHRARLTEPMRRPQREHENRDIWEKLQCRVTTVRHETRFKWRVPLLVAVVFLLAVAIASVVLFLNWRSDVMTETRQSCGQRCTSEDLDRLKRFLDLDEPTYVLYGRYLGLVWDCRDLSPPPVRVDPRRSRCDQPRSRS